MNEHTATWIDYPTTAGWYIRKVLDIYWATEVKEDNFGLYFIANHHKCEIDGPGWGVFFKIPD
jgi:hypothetical protein